MKVKDVIGWLQSDKWTRGGFMWHYYPNKRKSACGKSVHPKTRFDAIYVIGKTCKLCSQKHGQPD